MDFTTKSKLKAQIFAMSSVNNAFKAAMVMPSIPVVAGVPPTPIIIQPALAPYLSALKMHAEEFDKLLKVLEELVDNS